MTCPGRVLSPARTLQQQVDYLRAENQILKEKLGDRKLDLTNADRRRLAVLGKELGHKFKELGHKFLAKGYTTP